MPQLRWTDGAEVLCKFQATSYAILVDKMVLIQVPFSEMFFCFLLLLIIPPPPETNLSPTRDKVRDYHIMGRQVGHLISDPVLVHME